MKFDMWRIYQNLSTSAQWRHLSAKRVQIAKRVEWVSRTMQTAPVGPAHTAWMWTQH